MTPIGDLARRILADVAARRMEGRERSGAAPAAPPLPGDETGAGHAASPSEPSRPERKSFGVTRPRLTSARRMKKSRDGQI
ncbi:hypothetical protein [Microcystis phage Mwe-JY25]